MHLKCFDIHKQLERVGKVFLGRGPVGPGKNYFLKSMALDKNQKDMVWEHRQGGMGCGRKPRQ